jgi:hypothetical protein
MKRSSRAASRTDQQPHGADGRDFALEALKRRSDVDLYLDSEYVRKGISQWIHNWKRNGWKTADKKPVKNGELWQRLDDAAAHHKISWHWVRGHAGHDYNERADELARSAIAQIRKNPGRKPRSRRAGGHSALSSQTAMEKSLPRQREYRAWIRGTGPRIRKCRRFVLHPRP